VENEFHGMPSASRAVYNPETLGKHSQHTPGLEIFNQMQSSKLLLLLKQEKPCSCVCVCVFRIIISWFITQLA